MGAGGAIWFHTARLRLRPVCAADTPDVVAGLNDPEIAAWLSTTPYPYPEADFQRYLDHAPQGETFSIHDDRGFVGLIGAGEELGFWVARPAQGRGYATEAAFGLLEAVFEFYPGPVRAGYFIGNHASARVLTTLGFVKTGQAPRWCCALGQSLDHVDLTLSRADFMARLSGRSPQA